MFHDFSYASNLRASLVIYYLQYNPIDAGYPASDEAMRQLMQKPQCAWMSITNGDNAYGSAVVSTVLGAAKTVTPTPNLVMLPMSSRNFDNLGRCCILSFSLLLCT